MHAHSLDDVEPIGYPIHLVMLDRQLFYTQLLGRYLSGTVDLVAATRLEAAMQPHFIEPAPATAVGFRTTVCGGEVPS